MNYRTLNNGIKIPAVGMGVFLFGKDNMKPIIKDAYDAGFRLFDTANRYNNEGSLGDAIKELNLPREELFITSKLWPSRYSEDKIHQAIEDTLKRLKIDYIDLMLLHKPFKDYVGAYKVLETYVEKGIIKSIGLSNFNIKQTKKILSICKIKPVINQIEFNPYYNDYKLKEFLDSENIITEAWCPLSTNSKKLIVNKTINDIAKKHNVTCAQVILRYEVQLGIIPIPSSKNLKHMKENLDVFDFSLDEEDLKKIKKLAKRIDFRIFRNIPWYLDALTDHDFNYEK